MKRLILNVHPARFYVEPQTPSKHEKTAIESLLLRFLCGATGLQTWYFPILFSVTNSILTPYLLLPAIKWSKKSVIHIVIYALLFVLLLAGYCSSLLSTYTKEWESVFLEQYDSHQWNDWWHYLWHYLWHLHFIWPNQEHILNVM